MPLHPLEKALVVVACLHLCFLPWAFGARDSWVQLTSAGLGLVSFVLAMLPRRYSGDLAPQGAFVLHPWSRALKFPVFWIGLFILAYIGCQALNPAYLRATAGIYWWLAPVQHVGWLPSSVDAPFERMNAWRILAILFGTWTIACALWVGISRRVSIQSILSAVAINGTLLALLGILQKITHAKGIFWIVTSAPSYFASTFFYKNHAGAYFNLIFSIAITLMSWHHLHGLRRMQRSSPAPVYAFGAVMLAAMVVLTDSRTAIILLTGYGLASATILFISHLRANKGNTHPAVLALASITAALLIGATGWFINIEKSIEQIRYITTPAGKKDHIESRVLARQATMDLYEANPVTGWGAGSFRHVFPLVQKNYPNIYIVPRSTNLQFAWDHAHNDYAQALAELGTVGFSFCSFIFVWFISKIIRLRILKQPSYLLCFIGILLPLTHAWVDFPLYNCAILTTLCAAGVLLLRWAELETTRP